MKSNFFLIAFILISSFCYSQEYEINGKVTEAQTGLPLPGATVVVKNGTLQTIADLDGNFQISGVPSGATLVFSYVGFSKYEFKVTKNEKITVVLNPDAESLEEVVVIGYGSQTKREVTGAVGIVSSKNLEDLRPVKIEQALQGTVSGVNVTTQSGRPGGNLDVRIRGIATNGENRPTFIVDGNIIKDIGLLNPNDIESLTVLKDAQAAIYGTIGANGVILITTKSGKKNSKTRISYNTYMGSQETSRKLPLLNATEYALLLNESYANAGNSLPFPNVSSLGKGTNWQDEVFDTGVPIISHDLSASGGSDKVTYNISGSHLDQGGIIGGYKSNFLRNTARLNLNADLTDKLRAKANVMYLYTSSRTFTENALGSVLFNAINTPSIYKPYDQNGNLTVLPSGDVNVPGSNIGFEVINPLAQIANTFNSYNLKRVSGSFALEYDVIKDLTVTGRIGFETSNSEGKTFNKLVDYGPGKVFNNPRSSVDQSAINDNSYTFDLFATYKKTLAENHNFALTAGTTVFKEYGNGLNATGFDVPNNSWEFADISLTTGYVDRKAAGSYAYDERRLSHFGRLQYDYKGKYLLSAMIRRDLSTKFGPSNRVAYFPSFTAGWVISDESFFPESKSINFLKLRGSYGTLGNDQIKSNAYISLLGGEATYIFNGQLVNGNAIGLLANPDVKWEEARKFDVGLDFRLFNNKVEIATDYFIDTRKDLLIVNVPISAITGIAAPGGSSPVINAGSVRNKGFEFAINYKEQVSDNFSFNINYNVTTLKNEVTEVNNGTGFIEGGLFGTSTLTSRMQVGHQMGYFYGYKTNGIFQNQAEVDAHPSQLALGAEAKPGDLRFVDVNGDNKIDANDRTDLGSPIPDVTMGLNFSLNYKGFDFTTYLFASIGNDMVRAYERTQNDVNRMNYTLGRWTGEGSTNSVPRVTTAATANNVFSDYFVEDASYLRIQNVQLGYTINSAFTEKAGISKLRIYTGVNNLYTFTKYMGYDPGASNGNPIGGGVDNGFYPIPRTYLFGVNVNF
ncbi:TonB-linked SusC/RagA family outer membrane protein [Flavobacterium sp. 28YEA47A]|uniref:SusC/RagA family TonB-linked outer membrane protein n=1 Tax=Flavobacterium sp. 28YEA47A TaxID=3156276 RepID=UPI00351368DD